MWTKSVCRAKSTCFDFSSSNFNLRGHAPTEMQWHCFHQTNQVTKHQKCTSSILVAFNIQGCTPYAMCVSFRISRLHLVTLVTLRVLDFLEFHNLPLMHLVLSPPTPQEQWLVHVVRYMSGPWIRYSLLRTLTQRRWRRWRH
jgi:hypothetical protein